MAYFLPGKWRTQPQVPVTVNWNHPFSSALAIAIVPGLSLLNLVGNSAPSITGTHSKSPLAPYKARGNSMGLNPSASSWLTYNSKFQISPTKFSIAASAAFTASGVIAMGDRSGASGWGLSSTGAGDVVRFDLILFGVANQQASTTADFFAGAYGKPRAFGASHVSNTTGGLLFYFDGAQLGTSVNTGVPITSTNPFQLHSYGDSGGQGSNLTWEYVYLWRDTLIPASWYAELAINPWQIFVPVKSKSYFGIFSSGGSGILVALVGNSATASKGTLGVTHTNALTGISNTFSRGTLTPALAKTLTGQSSTFSGGLFTTTHTNPLTGRSATFNGGTITPFISSGITLSGLSSTFSRGTLGLTHTNPLTGQGATFSGGLFSFGTAPVTARLVLTQREAGMVFKKRKTRMVLG